MSDEKYRTEEFRVNGEELLGKIKELVHEGNIRRIVLKDESGKTLVLNIDGALHRIPKEKVVKARLEHVS